VFEGRDGSGKTTTIEHLVSDLDPQNARVVRLSKPGDAELGRSYFERYRAHLPEPGEIALFDRSWYNRAGLERVMGYCSEEQATDFLTEAPRFERQLIDEGILLFKFWLWIDRDEQISRIRSRPDGTPIDRASLELWDDYTRVEREMFRRTSTDFAPWIWVDGHDLLTARAHVLRWLRRGLDHPARLHPPSADPSAIRLVDPLAGHPAGEAA